MRLNKAERSCYRPLPRPDHPLLLIPTWDFPRLYAIVCFPSYFVFSTDSNLDESLFLQVTSTHSAPYYIHLVEGGAQASGQLLRVVIGPKVHEKQVRCLYEHVTV